MPLHTPRRRVLFGIACVAGLAALLCLAQPLVRRLERAIARQKLQAAWDHQKAAGTRMPAAPIAWIHADAWDLDQPIVEDAHPDALEKAPALRPIEGDNNGIMIYAHRDRHFRTLQRASPGDRVHLRWYDATTLTYALTDIDVVPRDAAQLVLSQKTCPGRIALLTCYPFRFVGPAPERTILWLDPIDLDARFAYTTPGLSDGGNNGEATQEAR